MKKVKELKIQFLDEKQTLLKMEHTTLLRYNRLRALRNFLLQNLTYYHMNSKRKKCRVSKKLNINFS